MAENQANGVAAPELDGVRIFVGNLPFKTRQEDLVELFKEFGEVKAARLAYRFRRPLGYAFVTLADLSAANAALVKLRDMEYNGRNLNVELAKPESAAPPPKAAGGEENAERRRRPRGPRKPRSDENASSDDDAAKRATQPRRRNFGGEGANADAHGEEGGADGRPRARRNRRRGPRTEGGAAASTDAPAPVSAEDAAAAREARKLRIREIQKQRAQKRSELPDSETQVFVSNIPYQYTEDDIIKAFDTLTISNVRVVRTNAGKSRGFCFIDFPTHEQQQRALQEIQHKQLENRSVSVRVAKIEPERPAEETEEAQ